MHTSTHIATHVYDHKTGYLFTRTVLHMVGYYLRSERDRAGHEVCVFTRTPRAAREYRPLTHLCRFRFERGKRIRWMSDGTLDTGLRAPPAKDAHRLRVRVPRDIAEWIHAHHTPQAWVRLLLTAFGGSPDERASALALLDSAPATYDQSTMLSMAQHAGRYVDTRACVQFKPERTIGARNSYFRSTGPMELDTREALQFVRAHRKSKPWQPIPLSAKLPASILTLPPPIRVLHTPINRPMVTVPLSLPAANRLPLQYAVNRWTNDTVNRWLAYLCMWGHAPEHLVPIRVACRLAAVLSGVPWISLFTYAGKSWGLESPHRLASEYASGREIHAAYDSALWREILGGAKYVP